MTATAGFEFQKKPISLEDFKKRMGSPLPEEFAILEASGGCVELHTFRKAAKSFRAPLSSKEADYAFCGMDENHDRKVCSFEFFGTLKIGHFFPSRSHLEHLREVGALEERSGKAQHAKGQEREDAAKKAAEKTTASSSTTRAAAEHSTLPPIPLSDLKQRYRGVPAIVSGHGEVTLRISSDSPGPTSEDLQKVGHAFKRGLEDMLSLDINIADVESIHLDGVGNPRDKTSMILWTAGTVDDGGALQLELRKKAASIQKRIENEIKNEGFEWLTHVNIWARVSLSYYGPTASRLPDGSKLVQDVGHRIGRRRGSV